MRDDTGHRGIGLSVWLGRLFGLLPEDPDLAADVRRHLRQAEVQAQAEAVARERPIRLLVIALTSAIYLVYLPWYLVALSALGVLLADGAEATARRVAMEYSGHRHHDLIPLATVFLADVFFGLPAAVLWHMPDPFTKAITVGIFSAAMMRLAIIRSIQPATGFAGTMALASLIAVSNSSYWLMLGMWKGFLFTTLIAVVSLAYVVAAIWQNHRQQRSAAVSRMAAQRASEAKSRFLSQISHELRTPLNAIIGTGTAAFLTATDAQTKQQLAVLLKSAEGLAVVLNDVLDISAVEEGHVQLRPRAGNVAEEVGQTVALFRPQAEAAGLDLRLVLQGDLPRALRLDFDRLRQCLYNLLSNALRHTVRGQIQVVLRFDPPGLLVIEVQDSGSGVPAGYEERIFQRYERVSYWPEGHGLGLAICRLLLERMGGTITLLPTDSGATFQIRLPADVVDEAPVPVLAGLQDLSGTRVLIVDDIATNRLVAATYLGLLGCAVLEAASGAAALDMVRGGVEVDLILLDINMPGMGGLETLSLVRALQGKAGRVPVVAMTADAQDHDRQTYLNAGLDGYVTKPVHLNALRGEMARVLALGKS